MGNDAVGTDDSTIANGDTRHDTRIVAYPHIVSNNYSPLTDEKPLINGHAHVFTCTCSMGVVGDEHIGACQ